MWPTILKVSLELMLALKLLAMTSMRSELGKIDLNKIFQSRKELNARILETLEETTTTWGITCDRYEILRIEPPTEVRRAMQLQAEAERTRRKDVILSEAKRVSDINIAEGRKQTEILKAQAAAESVEIKARKEKEGLQLIASNIINGGENGMRVLDYIVKRKYYEEYANIIKNGNVTIVPESTDANGNQSNSDVLAAVSLMMQRNQSGPSYDTQRRREAEAINRVGTDMQSLKSATQAAGGISSGQSRGSGAVDWNSIQHFNNKNLDGRR